MNNLPLTRGDYEIIERSIAEKNPGIFTNYYLRNDAGGYYVFPGSVRNTQYLKWWQENDKPATFVTESSGVRFEVEYAKRMGEHYFFEKRGALPLPWALDAYRAEEKEKYILGLTGTGKSMNVGLLFLYMCAITPYFKAMNVAPLQFQSKQMFDSVKGLITGSLFSKKFISWHGKKWYREQPVLQIDFINGASFEFLNVEKGADNVQSWFGDALNVDEAGQLRDLDENGRETLAGIAIGLATRLRGVRPDQSPRMGWMSMITFGYDCETFWNRLEEALKPNSRKYGKIVRHADNPYLSPADIQRIRDNVPPGEEDMWLEGKRPQPRGAEISGNLIKLLVSRDLLENAIHQQTVQREGWLVTAVNGNPLVDDDIGKDGDDAIRFYEEPYVPNHIYMMVGDPGTGSPPDRNAPVICVWDVTDFPEGPAKLVCFWWGDGGGSYRPFIDKFSEYMHRYRVDENFRGYDSTSNQKAIAELSWQSEGMVVQPLGFDGSKKWQYLNALKLLLGKGLMKCPDIHGIRTQLSRYKLPDRKIPQDVVSAFSMGAFLLYPLYRAAYPEYAEEKADQVSGFSQESSRDYRPNIDRNSFRQGRTFISRP